MKNLLFLLLFISTTVFGQTSDKFKTAVKKGLEQLSAGRTTADFVQTANYFERISQAEPTEWYPVYYSAYSSLVAGLLTDDKALKDQYFDKALKLAAAAGDLSKNNSEIYVLIGYAQYMKMSVDPPSRLEFMAKSAASLETAKSLDPENPRVYLVRGQDAFYTPEAFGGGKVPAKPLLEASVAKYETFKPADELAPSWGAGQAKTLLERCK